MKVAINGRVIFELTQDDLDILYASINQDACEKQIEQKIKWIILETERDGRLNSIAQHWRPILSQIHTSLPTSDRELFKLIKQHPDYKCQKTKDAEFMSVRMAELVAMTEKVLSDNQDKYNNLKAVSDLEGATQEQIDATAAALEVLNANVRQLAEVQRI